MRTAVRLLLAVLIAPSALAAEVKVRVSGGLVDVSATAAPLREVLTQLAQETGMKIVYDGALASPLVTVTLPQRTPVEAVLALFEGLGINYAMRMDAGGTLVDTLILSSGGSGGSSSRSTPVPPPAVMPTAPQRFAPRPVPRPEADVEPPEEHEAQEGGEEEQPPPGTVPGPEGPAVFTGPIPGPGRPGSPFGTGQIGPLLLPTPTPPPANPPVVPGRANPVPRPTPSPSS